MATTTRNVRVRSKSDTSANWTAADPVLLDGEIITVVTAAGEIRHKTGNGSKRYTQLPFDDEAVRNLVNSKHTEIMSSEQPSGLAVGDDWDKIL